MTATDELRRLLDERGVEHEDSELIYHGNGSTTYYTEWGGNDDGDGANVYVEYTDGTVLRMFDATPEQAIAATLGGGECKNVSKLNRDGVAAYFFTCSECGLSVCASMGIGEIELKSPLRFAWKHGIYEFERCPRCGKVVEQ